MARGADFKKKPMGYFLDALASDSVSPGGGSAAALTGACGAALVEMTARINADREKRKAGVSSLAARTRIAAIKTRRARLEKLVTLDAVTFTRSASFFKRDKNTAPYQRALKDCVRAPFEICELSLQVADLALAEMSRTSRWLASDLAEGARLLAAAFDAGRLNVSVNMKQMSDLKFSTTLNARLDRMQSRLNANTNELEKVLQR